MEAPKLNDVSLEEYISIEKEMNTRYEYHAGRIFAIAGGTIEHGLISSNLMIGLGIGLRGAGGSCRPINNDVKLHIIASNKYLYPDAMVICNDLEKSEDYEHALTNPTVTFEVLSESTEAYDRGDKFFFYKKIPSLLEYVLIEQHQPVIDVYTRKSELWRINRVQGLDEILHLSSIGIDLPLRDIYQDVLV